MCVEEIFIFDTTLSLFFFCATPYIFILLPSGMAGLFHIYLKLKVC